MKVGYNILEQWRGGYGSHIVLCNQLFIIFLLAFFSPSFVKFPAPDTKNISMGPWVGESNPPQNSKWFGESNPPQNSKWDEKSNPPQNSKWDGKSNPPQN